MRSAARSVGPDTRVSQALRRSRAASSIFSAYWIMGSLEARTARKPPS
jgi:hypothetical protein